MTLLPAAALTIVGELDDDAAAAADDVDIGYVVVGNGGSV